MEIEIAGEDGSLFIICAAVDDGGVLFAEAGQNRTWGGVPAVL